MKGRKLEMRWGEIPKYLQKLKKKKNKVVVPVTKILLLSFSEFQKYHENFVEILKNTMKLNIKIKTTDNPTINENI